MMASKLPMAMTATNVGFRRIFWKIFPKGLRRINRNLD
jgi:hypothetical protein